MLFLPTRALSADDGADLFQITVIDVGKGDCILVQTGENIVMIDTGYNTTSAEVLQYLQDHHISRLDAMVISHFHKDHVGGAAAILDKIPVDMVYMPDYEGSRDVYQEMLGKIREKNIPSRRLTESLIFQAGEAEYTLISSGIAFDPVGENDNDVSMSASVRYKGHTAFFAGDLEEAGITSLVNYAESHGLDLSCDILKLPHHGRTSDNSQQLLDLISPRYALITDGSSQRAYGTMTDMLKSRNIAYLCSAADGTYIIKASGADDYEFTRSRIPDQQTGGSWIYTLSADGNASIAGYTGDAETLEIPSEIDGQPVTAISDFAFYNRTTLKSVTVPESVTSIGDSAFAWCSKLKSITLPQNLKSLGAGAFSWCEKLASLDLPSGVTSIGEYTFFHCKDLTEFTIHEKVTSIGESAFSHCNKLEQITIPSSVEKIEEDAFKKCKRLKTVVIENGLKTIKKSMFSGCESLERISIPASVKTIKSSVFENCTNLRDIYYDGTEEMWNKIDKPQTWDTGLPADKTIHFTEAPDDPTPVPAPDDHFFPIPIRETGMPATGLTGAAPAPRPKDLQYKELGLTIEIPSISAAAEIVRVPLTEDGYPVAWLGNYAGLPEGSFLPGEGTSVIAAHNHLDQLAAGPFALLKFVSAGDRIFINRDDKRISVFVVYANVKIGSTDFTALETLAGAKENTLILITCEDETAAGTYENRRIIAAEPLRIYDGL